MSLITIILPPREGFTPQHFGAISLCVRDFTEHSRFKAQSSILGGVGGVPFAGMPYTHLPQKKAVFSSQTALYAKAIVAHLRQHPAALVEIHNRPVLVKMIAQKWQGNIALHLHNDPQTMRAAKTVKEREHLSETCAVIYCVSDFIRERFIENIAVHHRAKVQVIYNGLKQVDAATLHKQKTILFVGRFQPEKGALELAQALSQILPDYPDWKAVFIGASRHDPNAAHTAYERDTLAALETVKTQIHMRGYCDFETTLQATKEAEIAVIPSRWNEAFGRTALEAMACGCATISSTRGGLKEVIGDAAYPLEEISSQTIADALQHLLQNPQTRETLKTQGIHQAQKFAIETVTAKLDQLRAAIL